MSAWISAKWKQRGRISAAWPRPAHARDVPEPSVSSTPRRMTKDKAREQGAELENLVRERTAELRQALEAAQQANLAKDAFLANVSHELRTPLGAVTGLSALALEHSEDERQREYLRKIRNAGKHLARLINDLLDLSKIVAGRMECESIPFHLRAMMRHARDVIRHRAEAKGLRLSFRIHNDVPEVLIGDPLRLEQILLNLVGNAIKFTSNGGVDVRVALTSSADGRACLGITVEDSGVGIRAEDVAGLFLPFAQADASMSRKFGGSGLGLALSQHLAQLMGGSISVSSREGVGSIFSLTVQLGIGSAANLPEDETDSVRKAVREHYREAHVLVVEDDAINIEIVGELLANVGIAPRLANNGQEALEILAEAGPGIFDLVLMDIQMPVMDGLAATRRIRDWPRFAGLPVIAMTAHALEHEKLIGTAAGMNDYVVKPFDLEDFYRVLAKWLPAGKKTLPAIPAAAPEPVGATGLAALQGVDTAGALKRFLGNEERYRHWLIQFVDEGPVVAAQIREALSAGQLELAARTAHSFKGGAGAIGLGEVHEHALALEVALKTRQAAEPELQRMESAIEAAREKIISALGL